MKQITATTLLLTCLLSTISSSAAGKPTAFFAASHPSIQYTGRIDFSNPALPRFWSPGVYIQAWFTGNTCNIILHDEMLYGSFHNYLEIVVDEQLLRIRMQGKTDTIHLDAYLRPGDHTLTICKNTESNIGYIEFAGIRCEALLPPPPKPGRKIEFIGNSITCGTGSDQSAIPCGAGQWQDQHNAYLSYGPVTARALHAQWQLSAVSGIGLIHSCCNLPITMPPVFDKVNLRTDSIAWDFSRYQPDVVTICLGQNDGIQDSTLFCNAYTRFIQQLRQHYPAATIICLTSPMADSNLVAVLQKYLSAIVATNQQQGDKKIYRYFFSKRYDHGCDSHPDLAEHQAIAGELTQYIRQLMQW
jgi:lysophospholipase L1-like esterase